MRLNFLVVICLLLTQFLVSRISKASTIFIWCGNIFPGQKASVFLFIKPIIFIRYALKLQFRNTLQTIANILQSYSLMNKHNTIHMLITHMAEYSTWIQIEKMCNSVAKNGNIHFFLKWYRKCKQFKRDQMRLYSR